jgi:hypothetical protein
MSTARKIDVLSVETVSTSCLVGFGVECTRLNFDMSTNIPSYKPAYEDFQCYAANCVDNLTNKDQEVEEFDCGLNDVDDAIPYTDPYHEFMRRELSPVQVLVFKTNLYLLLKVIWDE